MNKKITFALYFGNRGFFPGEVIADAISDMKKAVTDCGFDYICMPTDQTRYGAVETIEEGKKFSAFLKANEGKFQGVILCLPNFGDENGGLVAFKNINVPVLIQAYPDEIGKMDFAHRRDAMCGKFAMCNALRQAGIKYTLTKEFVVHPASESFHEDLKRFAALCRVVDGMRSVNIGAIGARTTAFKTVRTDEIALQRKGINVEALDLSEIFSRMRTVSEKDMLEKKDIINAVTTFRNYPEEKLNNLARLQVVLEDIIKQFDLDAVAIRCWNEFQLEFGIAPCICLGLLNDMGIPAACELDINNAVMMRALSLASNGPCMLLDWNNNYGNDKNKNIAFHCGPCAPSSLEGKGEIIEHLMFKKTFGDGTGVGVNKGTIRSGDVTFGTLKTEDGKLFSVCADAKFTDDEIEEAFFGCGKVIEKENIDNVSNYLARNGYKHHIGFVYGHYADAIKEALEYYLEIETEVL